MSTLGQFFTPPAIIDIIGKTIIEMGIRGMNGLEPSVGSGNLLPLFGSMNVDAYEIDTNLLPLIPKRNELSVINEDYLLNQTKKQYDLIIANPPYVELREFAGRYTNAYKEYIYGRSNIYILFIVKIIEQLSVNGFAFLIIPTAFRVNVSASKARKFMLDNCEVISLINYGNFSKEVCQSVMILCLKKRNVPIDTQMENNALNDDGSTLSVSEITIQNIGCVVKSGSIMWNDYKEQLVDSQIDESVLPLLYAFNITGTKNHNVEKKPFIHGFEIAARTFIAIPRISSGSVNAVLIENKKMIVENHVITIEHENIDVLKRIMLSVPFERRSSASSMITISEVKGFAIQEAK